MENKDIFARMNLTELDKAITNSSDEEFVNEARNYIIKNYIKSPRVIMKENLNELEKNKNLAKRFLQRRTIMLECYCNIFDLISDPRSVDNFDKVNNIILSYLSSTGLKLKSI